MENKLTIYDVIVVGAGPVGLLLACELSLAGTLIGLSVESYEQLLNANSEDIQYIGLSPIFASRTKPDLKTVWGLSGLKSAREKTHHSIVAIGGLSWKNTQELFSNGADGIASASAICSSEDPYASAKQFKDEILNYEKI